MPDLHVVLVQPEIPQNTGSIARLCAATHTRLHLIRPLGFSLDDRYLKRAGLDYWPWVDVVVHDDFAAYRKTAQTEHLALLSARASRSYLEIDFERSEPLHLLLGSETKGLPQDVKAEFGELLFKIPIFSPHVRSLNLANAASIVLYEALRRRGRLA